MPSELGELRLLNLNATLRDLRDFNAEAVTAMREALLVGGEIVAKDARDYFDQHTTPPGSTTDYIRARIGGSSIVYVESTAVSKHVRGKFGAKVMAIMATARSKKRDEVVVAVQGAIDAVVEKFNRR